MQMLHGWALSLFAIWSSLLALGFMLASTRADNPISSAARRTIGLVFAEVAGLCGFA